MTEQLKCPCGKRHGVNPRGAMSHISEHLNNQVHLYHDWGAAPTPLPTGYEPMRIAVPPEMEPEARSRFRRQDARQVADRAMARGRHLHVGELTITPRAAEHARQMGQSLQEYMGIPQRGCVTLH